MPSSVAIGNSSSSQLTFSCPIWGLYQFIGPNTVDLLGLGALSVVQVPAELQVQPEVGIRAKELGESKAEDGPIAPEEALGEVVDALRELRDQGKVRFWGMTAVGEAAALHRVIDSATLNSVRSVYNLVNPSAG